VPADINPGGVMPVSIGAIAVVRVDIIREPDTRPNPSDIAATPGPPKFGARPVVLYVTGSTWVKVTAK